MDIRTSVTHRAHPITSTLGQLVYDIEQMSIILINEIQLIVIPFYFTDLSISFLQSVLFFSKSR